MCGKLCYNKRSMLFLDVRGNEVMMGVKCLEGCAVEDLFFLCISQLGFCLIPEIEAIVLYHLCSPCPCPFLVRLYPHVICLDSYFSTLRCPVLPKAELCFC